MARKCYTFARPTCYTSAMYTLTTTRTRHATNLHLRQAKLHEIQRQGHKSFSSLVNKMIELGLEVFEESSATVGGESAKKKKELIDKHTEYLLRIMGMTSDILRCVYDKDKSKNNSESAEESLSIIKLKTQAFIDGFLESSP